MAHRLSHHPSRSGIDSALAGGAFFRASAEARQGDVARPPESAAGKVWRDIDSALAGGALFRDATG
jgi:hypothetical protein